MEMEELRERWTAFDNRLKKSEILRDDLIREIIHAKTERSLSRLVRWDLFSLVLFVLSIPYVAYLQSRIGGRLLLVDVLFFTVMALAVLGTLWGSYMLYGLLKIDFNKALKENFYRINRYNIQVKRQTQVVAMGVGPLLIVLSVLVYAALRVPVSLWIYLICVFVLASGIGYVMYKRTFLKNIHSILDSLKNLKEIEEKEEEKESASELAEENS